MRDCAPIVGKKQFFGISERTKFTHRFCAAKPDFWGRFCSSRRSGPSLREVGGLCGWLYAGGGLGQSFPFFWKKPYQNYSAVITMFATSTGVYHMPSVIRPLTLAERKKPAQLTYFGGFKNVSFQIGEVVLPSAANKNSNGATPSYVKAIVRKSATVQFPIMVPNSLGVLKGPTNTVASVIGQKNKYGGHDAVLVARSTERLSSFNSKLRTVEDLVKTTEAQSASEDERLGKSFNARIHNQVMLAGVVVGARFEDGESPRFHIDLRQDSNPDNIIPLTYESRNASAMVSKVKYGSLIYVDGEYAFRSMPIHEVDETGQVKLNGEGKPIVVMDEKGQPARRIHTYIRITSPKDPAEFDTDFGRTVPRWVAEIAEEISAARARSAPSKAEMVEQKVDAPEGGALGETAGTGASVSLIDDL